MQKNYTHFSRNMQYAFWNFAKGTGLH